MIARIFHSGYSNKTNVLGIKYYKSLIKELKANNILPFITLYHWDLPQPLQDVGGWQNPQIADWYADYANLCFELYGDSVKHWITFNEPKQTCHMGYGTGDFAPEIKSPEAEYQCAHNVIKAHAKAWHIYDTTYRKKQNGNLWEKGVLKTKTNIIILFSR